MVGKVLQSSSAVVVVQWRWCLLRGLLAQFLQHNNHPPHTINLSLPFSLSHVVMAMICTSVLTNKSRNCRATHS